MKELLRLRRLALALTTAALFMLAPPVIWADDDDDSDEETIEWDEAEVFFELNNTDGDLGIHSSIDGEPWKELEIEGPSGREVLDIDARGNFRLQGLTQLFFESAEPTFDELGPEDFFARFPEGEYEIEGTSLEGEEIESTTELTHVMPAPPIPTVNTVPIPIDIVCDVEDPAYNAPEVSTSITIAWGEVMSSHPDLGIMPVEEIEVHNYEVVVEADVDVGNDEELTVIFSAIVPPEVTSMTIPDEFIELSDEWKYEILVREESFNQTAIESCFQIANGE